MPYGHARRKRVKIFRKLTNANTETDRQFERIPDDVPDSRRRSRFPTTFPIPDDVPDSRRRSRFPTTFPIPDDFPDSRRRSRRKAQSKGLRQFKGEEGFLFPMGKRAIHTILGKGSHILLQRMSFESKRRIRLHLMSNLGPQEKRIKATANGRQTSYYGAWISLFWCNLKSFRFVIKIKKSHKIRIDALYQISFLRLFIWIKL